MKRENKSKKTPTTTQAPTHRGFAVPGGGLALRVEPAPEWRGTSVQVCGLWPFSAGSSSPVVGVPLGRHLDTAATVCGDPVSYFLANLISQPSAFVLGRPGLGKSSLVRHIVSVVPAWGIVPMILSDLKPDYVDVIRALDGQVIQLGRGLGSVNPLDPGPIVEYLGQLAPEAARQARADLEGRRVNVLIGLMELARGEALMDREKTLLTRALRLLDQHDHVPVIGDMRELITSRPAELAAVAQDRGDTNLYMERTERILDALITLDIDGPFGDMFGSPTTTRIELDRPVVFDIHALEEEDLVLQAGVQLVCWSYGSAVVSAARYLADAGLAEQRIYLMVMDELWRLLRANEVMVDRIDALTRLNRQRGLAQIMITHTMADLVMPTEADTAKAWGFVERSAMVFLGGLADKELGNLREVFAMSQKEEQMITSWSTEASADSGSGTAAAPPGLGRFLLKLGKGPGIPFQTQLTATELSVNDTNRRWHGHKEQRRQLRVQVA